MKDKIVNDMDWDKSDVVFLLLIGLLIVPFFIYGYGVGLTMYPLIIGSASLIILITIILVWFINKYLNIRKVEAQPNAVEILNQKYAKGELTEEELEEKTEKVLND